ncbi:hypothetical protein K466DRAFT_563688 [Polyporus arcularius HHB13444]|uniref:Uncharacterized protein n=1 Tax=Polyporus arcularius HHB13444 TaxID=1314778 RepID=A0A5C3PKW1_9APHY|nr:hypothetical protein K466DRAFT_563688 [Polyporus arcularius HHB13444]
MPMCLCLGSAPRDRNPRHQQRQGQLRPDILQAHPHRSPGPPHTPPHPDQLQSGGREKSGAYTNGQTVEQRLNHSPLIAKLPRAGGGQEGGRRDEPPFRGVHDTSDQSAEDLLLPSTLFQSRDDDDDEDDEYWDEDKADGGEDEKGYRQAEDHKGGGHEYAVVGSKLRGAPTSVEKNGRVKSMRAQIHPLPSPHDFSSTNVALPLGAYPAMPRPLQYGLDNHSDIYHGSLSDLKAPTEGGRPRREEATKLRRPLPSTPRAYPSEPQSQSRDHTSHIIHPSPLTKGTRPLPAPPRRHNSSLPHGADPSNSESVSRLLQSGSRIQQPPSPPYEGHSVSSLRRKRTPGRTQLRFDEAPSRQ